MKKDRDERPGKGWGAKAIQGTPPEESLKWATAELHKISGA